MPTVSAERLEEITRDLLVGAGATKDEAASVAEGVIGANLAGHDSHGIIQIPSYIERIEVGHIVCGAPMDVVRETATTMVVDGNWGFGYHVSKFVMQSIIDKAAAGGVAAATVYRQGHVGRVAAYPIMAAKAGMIGMMTADSGRTAKGVVPFGGREARLGTNPICFAMPSNLEGPLFIDMATSAVAAGKISLAIARGKEIPEGWILDKNGNATTDPHDYSDGGTILPLGGTEGHKGYGLSAIVEIFSGLLTGLGFGVDPTGRHNDGCFMAAFNVEAFRSLETFKQEVTEFAQYLKSTPTAKGFDEVYYPGELEHLRSLHGREHGIEVEESTWARLQATATKYGVGDLGS